MAAVFACRARGGDIYVVREALRRQWASGGYGGVVVRLLEQMSRWFGANFERRTSAMTSLVMRTDPSRDFEKAFAHHSAFHPISSILREVSVNMHNLSLSMCEATTTRCYEKVFSREGDLFFLTAVYSSCTLTRRIVSLETNWHYSLQETVTGYRPLGTGRIDFLERCF